MKLSSRKLKSIIISKNDYYLGEDGEPGEDGNSGRNGIYLPAPPPGTNACQKVHLILIIEFFGNSMIVHLPK